MKKAVKGSVVKQTIAVHALSTGGVSLACKVFNYASDELTCLKTGLKL